MRIGRRFPYRVGTQSFAFGTNIVRNCRATGDRLSAQAHQRWATDLLFDMSLSQVPCIWAIEAIWTPIRDGRAANSVVWNSSAATWSVENPPTALALSGKPKLGIRQARSPHPVHGDPWEIISPGRQAKPQSLYEQQLSDRTGLSVGQSQIMHAALLHVGLATWSLALALSLLEAARVPSLHHTDAPLAPRPEPCFALAT